MKTHTVTTYGINELTAVAKEQAIASHLDWNLQDSWWHCTYEDAEMIGLKITSSDIYRNEITGELLKDAEEVARLIIESHGEECETYRLAKAFEARIETRRCAHDWQEDGADEDWSLTLEQEGEAFLDGMLKVYASILSREHDYLSGDEAITESFEANETQFLSDGRLAPSYLQ